MPQFLNSLPSLESSAPKLISCQAGASKLYWFKGQSQSYVMIDDQSASLSWCQAPIWELRPDFNVENVIIIRGCKWNEAISNIKCNVSNTQCNTCATSYVTADNSRSIAYLISKVIYK
jgi:hypothetical protein